MDCKEAEKLVYLFKAGELNENEQELLADHCKHCSTCRGVNLELKKLHVFTKAWQTATLSTSGTMSTSEIMENIPFPNQKQKHSLFPLVQVAFLRRVLTTAAVFLIALFAYQQIEIKQNINELNEHIRHQGTQNTSTDEVRFSRLNYARKAQKTLSGDQWSTREKEEILEILKNEYPEVYEKIAQDIKQEVSNL